MLISNEGKTNFLLTSTLESQINGDGEWERGHVFLFKLTTTPNVIRVSLFGDAPPRRLSFFFGFKNCSFCKYVQLLGIAGSCLQPIPTPHRLSTFKYFRTPTCYLTPATSPVYSSRESKLLRIFLLLWTLLSKRRFYLRSPLDLTAKQ